MKILGYAVVDKDGNTGVGRVTHFLPHPDSAEVRDLDAPRFAPHRLEELVAKSEVDKRVSELEWLLADANARGDGWRDKFDVDTEELAALRRQLECFEQFYAARGDLRQDADRYQFLRRTQGIDGGGWVIMQASKDDWWYPGGSDLDAAIDAALAAQKAEKEVV